MEYVVLLSMARAHVIQSPLYRKFIRGTPLENDIAVWMADFASDAIDTARRDEAVARERTQKG